METKDPEQVKAALLDLQSNDPKFVEQILSPKVGGSVLDAAAERGLLDTIIYLLERGAPVGAEAIAYWYLLSNELEPSDYLRGLAIFITAGAQLDTGLQKPTTRHPRSSKKGADFRDLLLQVFGLKDKGQREELVVLLDQTQRRPEEPVESNKLLTKALQKYNLTAAAVCAMSVVDVINLVVDDNMDEWLLDLIHILFRERAYQGSHVEPTLRASVMSHFSV